ncbi:glycosyltransferase [Steroidobacter sp.]|uniref:glycosyltransferase n=1 Tax=Steroidobacter sp. TaxID=1978227 RepID=UPI001A4BD0C6|nr:glycosyltransferase [Steroidobacter sp.]MBL8267856.1 glycosyltransferase [Steroidobacter sp.]
MNIVHAVETINPVAGGPVKSASSLAAAQSLLGHKVVLVCYRESEHAEFETLLRRGLPGEAGVEIHGVHDSRIERFQARSAARSFERLARSADVIHVHGVWRPFTLAAATAALQARRKLVISPRGMLDPWSLRQKRLKKWLALQLVWRRVLDQASFVHALNEDEAALLEPLRLKSECRVFPNGAFPELFEKLPASELFLKRVPGLKGRRYVLFLSRLHHKKGLDYLVDAFATVAGVVPDVDLVIAGPDEGAERDTQRRVEALGLRARVHFVGLLNGAEKLAAISGAASFCLPSRQEGFSMAIIEALSCSVPVVISEQCHFPEVASAGAGKVVQLSGGEVAAALLSYLQDDAARQQAALAARKLARDHYSWHQIARRMTGAYEAVAPASSGVSPVSSGVGR